MRAPVLAALLLAACGGGNDPPPISYNWQAGPVIDGRNYSSGIVRNGDSFSFGDLHYVTRPGSLAGKSRMALRYRLEGKPYPTTGHDLPPLITLYFQREGDDWSGKGKYETYRWYATFATQTLTEGEHEMTAPLDGNWTAIQTSSAETKPQEFADARANADRVGFVLGGGTGYGHGVTGPATITILDFRVD